MATSGGSRLNRGGVEQLGALVFGSDERQADVADTLHDALGGALDLAGRWKDWRERRRLEKLLRNSGFTEGEPRWRDDEERRRR